MPAAGPSALAPPPALCAGAYAGTIIAILAFGVVSTALRLLRARYDAAVLRAAGACTRPAGRGAASLLASTAGQNVVRAALTGGLRWSQPASPFFCCLCLLLGTRGPVLGPASLRRVTHQFHVREPVGSSH
jgi:hypothetical protein